MIKRIIERNKKKFHVELVKYTVVIVDIDIETKEQTFFFLYPIKSNKRLM